MLPWERNIALGERNEFLRQRDEALAEIERLKGKPRSPDS